MSHITLQTDFLRKSIWSETFPCFGCRINGLDVVVRLRWKFHGLKKLAMVAQYKFYVAVILFRQIKAKISHIKSRMVRKLIQPYIKAIILFLVFSILC